MYNIKATITSICPTCKKKWSREDYIDIPIGVLGLTICEKCSEEIEKNGIMLINKWEPKHED